MAALTDLTLAQLKATLDKKEASAVEVAEAHLKKLDEHRALNAFITETPERAREMAKAADARRAKGEARPARRRAAGHQGPVLHRGRADHGRLAHPRRLRAAV